ncbi:MAG: SRPBCC domain-containing protein [Rhizobiaceae bacterium]
MSLKKDADGKRYVEMELELSATPEEVWHAMATGQGYAAWFVPADIDERVGGDLTFHLMPGVTSGGKVTIWEPPHRFGYEEYNWSGEAPPVATEITIETLSGGICKMHMVHSLFTSRDDWDDEMESFEKGWPGFFRILRIYLENFAGKHAAQSQARGNFKGSSETAWKKLAEAFGFVGAKIGDAKTVAAGGGRLDGTVEHVTTEAKHHELLLRLDEPGPGVANIGSYEWGGQTHVAVQLIFYGDDADAVLSRETPYWEKWMGANFPAAAPPQT